MASCSTEEGWHTLPDSHRLYTKTWKPNGETKAVILFLHGFSDHVNRFEEFFTALASRGIEVHGFDQRGWGRSVTKKSERGLSGPTVTVMSDITAMLETLIPMMEELDVPIFLVGHSMGGGETLYYAAGGGPEETRKHIRGYVALAPYIKLHPASQPSRALVVAGRLALKVLPNWQMEQKLKPENLSRDPEIGKSWDADELCHNIGTLEGMGGMIDRGEELEKGKLVVKEGSVYIAHGTSDLITDCDTSRLIFEKMPVQDKTLKTYEGFYHVLHGEPGDDKVQFFNDTASWILAHSERTTTTTTTTLRPPEASSESSSEARPSSMVISRKSATLKSLRKPAVKSCAKRAHCSTNATTTFNHTQAPTEQQANG